MTLGTTLLFERETNKKAVPVTQLEPFPVQISGAGASPFGEVVTAKRTPIIELNASYGASALRDVEQTTNSATITAPGTGEILLSTGATASSRATLFSAERGRYVPGYAAEVGVGVRIPTSPTGNQEAFWGLIDPDQENGIYFGIDSDGIYAAVKRNDTEIEKTHQSDWNIDTLQGTGPSGVTLDIARGNIFQIDFTWYGYGQILFGMLQTVGAFQRFIPVHQFRPVNQTSLVTPNLPVVVEANNGGDASDFDVYVGGRQYTIVGDYIPKFRFTGQERTGVSVGDGVVEPLVSFRNKTGFEDRSLKIAATNLLVATTDVVVEIYLDATLTGESWTTPTNATAAETSIETDVSATALTGGTLIWNDLAESGQANRQAASAALQNFDIPENQVITLAARGLGGTATVDAFMRMQEEW